VLHLMPRWYCCEALQKWGAWISGGPPSKPRPGPRVLMRRKGRTKDLTRCWEAKHEAMTLSWLQKRSCTLSSQLGQGPAAWGHRHGQCLGAPWGPAEADLAALLLVVFVP